MSTYFMPTGVDATTTASLPVPTSISPPTNDTKPELLCDWIRSASDCRDADFIRSLLITSSVMHGLVFLFAVWLLIYRNRGLNRKIVTELFVKVGTGVRPKPVSKPLSFTSIASKVRAALNQRDKVQRTNLPLDARWTASPSSQDLLPSSRSP